MNDDRIQDYCRATQALEHGDFHPHIPTDVEDELGNLGRGLESLARSLERQFLENQKIAEVSNGIIEGLFLDEVLDHLYESFRTVIPYDHIGYALIEKTLVRSRWARSEASKMRIRKG